MNNCLSIIILACLSFSFTSSAQIGQSNGSIQFSLQKLNGETWGVFVRPNSSITPSTRTSMGSGQVTLVAPVHFEYKNLKNKGGTWIENARVNGPIEAHNKAYISFGFIADSPKLNLYPDHESLLFTFETSDEFNGKFQLFENNSDPFAVPNSYESNPGNDIGIIDYGLEGGLKYYTYEGNQKNADDYLPLESLMFDRNGEQAKAVLTKNTSAPNVPE